MTKATQKTSRNRAATLKAVEADAKRAMAADFTFIPDKPAAALSVTAAANEARLASDQATALNTAEYQQKEGDDLRLAYSVQCDHAQGRAEAMRDTAMMLLAANPFEALMQAVYLAGDIEDVGSQEEDSPPWILAKRRIDFALESIMRVLEEESGRSRKEAGDFFLRLERYRPHMEAVPAEANS